MAELIRRRLRLPASLALVAALLTTTACVQAASPVDGASSGAAAVERARSSERTSERRASGDAVAWLAVRARQSAAATIGAGLVASSQAREQALERSASVLERVPLRVDEPKAGSFSGRNRFWIPSLGMSYPVHLFECTRSRYPGNVMYRWGCAGSNNVYIFGHASSVMKPFHDLFEGGRLRVGMVAMYADGAGRIRQYRVTEWRVVRPDQPDWAVASQAVPSMTLQTCVGERGELRLNVRLVADD